VGQECCCLMLDTYIFNMFSVQTINIQRQIFSLNIQNLSHLSTLGPGLLKNEIHIIHMLFHITAYNFKIVKGCRITDTSFLVTILLNLVLNRILKFQCKSNKLFFFFGKTIHLMFALNKYWFLINTLEVGLASL